MNTANNIKNQNELEFAVFCIENLAIKLKTSAKEVYNILCKTNILKNYIIPSYDVLHTQSKEYIINDILEVIHNKGVKI